MTIRMYDLAGAEPERRFSPYCWRVRMALAHKELEHETIPWRFTEKDAISFSGQGRVPVIVDRDRVVADSWAIASYLEEAYPSRPLFGAQAARGAALLVKHWVEQVVHPVLLPIILTDVFRHLHPRDRTYFRTTREQRFGTGLEEVCTDPEAAVHRFRDTLEPLRATLRQQPFVAGDSPAFVDYIPFGALQWARCISPVRLLESADPVAAWRARLLEAYDGLAARAPGYAV